MKKHLFLLATILLIFSCNKTSRVLIDVREVDFKNKSDATIKGTPVDAQWPLDIQSLAVCDSFLLVWCGQQDHMMYVYSDQLELKGRFCTIGRARYEFLSRPRWYSSQILRSPQGDALIPLVIIREGLKVMDLQKSLESQGTVITMQSEFKGVNVLEYEEDGHKGVGYSAIYYLFLDNDINHIFERNNHVILDNRVHPDLSFDIMDDTARIKHFNFLSKIEWNDEEYLRGRLFKHPDRNIIVNSFTYMDYILFFDLDNDRTFAIHQSGSLSLDDDLPIINDFITDANGHILAEQESTVHFSDAAYAESFFMITYYAGDYSLNAPNPDTAAPELLFFDWDGNFIKSVKLDTHVADISYDEGKQILYGIDRENDRIISFDLSDVVTDITK